MVIGRYEPSRFTAETIGEELLRLTDSLNLHTSPHGQCWSHSDWADLKSASEVRSPEEVSTPMQRLSDASSFWHQDVRKQNCWMVLWSNREQTEIRTMDGTVLNKLEPYDVILIHNTLVEHRTPEKVSNDRWFFRRFVIEPEWLQK
jgi:hypothetical protein